MRLRLTLWSFGGLIVSSGWVLIFANLPKRYVISHALLNVIDITAPAALLGHFPLKYYWFILLNTLTYFLVGVMFEVWRRSFIGHSSSSHTA